jgi:transposase-like protein
VKGLTEAEVDRIVELYEAGFSISETATLAYVSRETVFRYLKIREVPRRPRGGWAYNKTRLSREDQDLTVFLYDKLGWSTVEISARLGISVSSVVHRLKRAGVPRRSRGESTKLRYKRRGRRVST